MQVINPFPQTIIEVMKTDVFWTAVGSLGTVAALFFAARQLFLSRKIEAYRLLRQEGERFESPRMVSARSHLARTLLQRPTDHEAIDDSTEDLLGFYEDLGLMLHKGITPIELVWITNSDYIQYFYCVLEGFIADDRELSGDPNYYTEFTYLYRKMIRYEKRRLGRQPSLTADDLREFLEVELRATIRRVHEEDIAELEKIEALSFKADAFDHVDFMKAYEKRRRYFVVADVLNEVVGYGLGTMGENGRADIDSIAVHPDWRNCGLGRRLVGWLIDRLREDGAKIYSLEVRTTSRGPKNLYESFDFHVVETLKSYYEDGADAYRMEMKESADEPEQLGHQK